MLALRLAACFPPCRTAAPTRESRATREAVTFLSLRLSQSLSPEPEARDACQVHVDKVVATKREKLPLTPPPAESNTTCMRIGL
jgi:hypothetical protein